MKKFLLFILLVCIKQINAQVCFSSATNYTTSNFYTSVISTDFNGDGFADIGVANYSSDSVSILLGTGAGTFGSRNNFAAGGSGSAPVSICSADFDGDGFVDLAVANYNSNNVSVLLGTGTGSFGPPTNFGAGSNPNSVCNADFNGDSFTDLAIANSNSNNVSVLLGTGTGSFGSATNFSVGINPYSVCCADFNEDGVVDLATANLNSNDVSILFGTGTGNFGAATNFSVDNGPNFIIKEDFNGDGHTDIATTNGSSNSVSILLGTGIGSFGIATNFAVGVSSAPISVCAADFNGDSYSDLATTNNSSNNFSILLGTGTGSFGTAIHFATGTAPFSICNNDFNGDIKVDLAITIAGSGQRKISIFLNSTINLNISVNASIVCPGSPIILTANGANSYAWSSNAGSATTNTVSVNPTVNTTYTVTGSNTTCTAVATSTITVVTPVVPVICLVSTDSLSLNNYIYWDKTLYTNVDSFIIYRYDVFSSQYLKIGAVSKDSLSQFIDTARTIGGPNGGDPKYSSWQYKLAILDSCGNTGLKSPYHATMFIQENLANFSWNAYTVETGQANPLTGYSFSRDDLNTGNWHVLVNTAGTSSTDPNFSSFPLANWRVEAQGFNCTPTLRLHNNSLQTAIVKSKSNISTNNIVTEIKELSSSNNLRLYPNPANNSFIIETNSTNKQVLQVFDINNELILSRIINSKIFIDVSELNEGIYNVILFNNEGAIHKKLIIIR